MQRPRPPLPTHRTPYGTAPHDSDSGRSMDLLTTSIPQPSRFPSVAYPRSHPPNPFDPGFPIPLSAFLAPGPDLYLMQVEEGGSPGAERFGDPPSSIRERRPERDREPGA